MCRNEKRKFVWKGLGLRKAMLYVFNFSLYASVTLQDLGVLKAFSYCCRLEDMLLQKYAISETLLYPLSLSLSCSLVDNFYFSTLNMSVHLYIEFIVSDEKSIVLHWSFLVWMNYFPLTASRFSVFSFQHFTMTI